MRSNPHRGLLFCIIVNQSQMYIAVCASWSRFIGYGAHDFCDGFDKLKKQPSFFAKYLFPQTECVIIVFR